MWLFNLTFGCWLEQGSSQHPDDKVAPSTVSHISLALPFALMMCSLLRGVLELGEPLLLPAPPSASCLAEALSSQEEPLTSQISDAHGSGTDPDDQQVPHSLAHEPLSPLPSLPHSPASLLAPLSLWALPFALMMCSLLRGMLELGLSCLLLALPLELAAGSPLGGAPGAGSLS